MEAVQRARSQDVLRVLGKMANNILHINVYIHIGPTIRPQTTKHVGCQAAELQSCKGSWRFQIFKKLQSYRSFRSYKGELEIQNLQKVTKLQELQKLQW